MAARPPASAAILTIALELTAVGMLTLIAGASKEAGTVVLIMMVGFWLIYGITESKVLYNLVGAFRSLSTYPANNATYGGLPGNMFENFGGAGNNMTLPNG